MIALSGLHRSSDIRQTFKINESQIDQFQPKFKTLLRISYKANISLSLFFSEENLEGHIHPEHFRQDDLTDDYTDKARQLIIYYIKRRMVELNMSLADLASASNISPGSIYAFLFDVRRTPNYFSLHKMAKALKTTLPELLEPFETDMARFDDLDLHIDIPEPRGMRISENNIQENQRLKERMNQALTLTNIPARVLKNQFNIDYRINRANNDKIQLERFFKVAHIAGISATKLLGHEDLSQLINPDRYQDDIKPLSRRQIEQKIRHLSRNIKREAENISEADLRPETLTYLRKGNSYGQCIHAIDSYLSHRCFSAS